MITLDIDQMIALVRKAGQRIMEIYETDFTIERKEDHSPLTEADRASHQIIEQELKQRYPDIPVLSEEGKDTPYEERKRWNRFWLVDPIDGTKEFIQKNDEFTVNIALIEHEYPVFGIVYAPALNTCYVASLEMGAFKIGPSGEKTSIRVNPKPTGNITIVESRSHPSPELEQFMAELSRNYQTVNRIQLGSSLKLCAVAEGVADLYPRLGPTMEWDIAAGQAIVEGAGGSVTTLNGERFRYNKESLLNDHFIVKCCDKI